ncbi:DUF3592 domain-containing protein [Nocardioides sp. AX2bis]|uniref:DUF3592 domain-containing protein n=1 Tax=Nocardioides sp. AX2bis TaxID=2653157 RepID=UPI0012F227E7|nr:hypothetical protein [Nocardioides sp. AX2bis]VXC55588.1 conserved hypothetical protein [Nocardioides sp. AX2bis]
MSRAVDTRRSRLSGRGATPALLAFLLLLALVGVATAMVGVLEERALSATTTGEIVSGETESLSAGGERCSGTIVFEVDGREWQTTDRVGGACPADGGESAVEVRYDPDSPYVAETGDSDEGPLGLTIFAGLGAVLLLVLLVRSLLARRRARADGTTRPSDQARPAGMYDEPPRP